MAKIRQKAGSRVMGEESNDTPYKDDSSSLYTKGNVQLLSSSFATL